MGILSILLYLGGSTFAAARVVRMSTGSAPPDSSPLTSPSSVANIASSAPLTFTLVSAVDSTPLVLPLEQKPYVLEALKLYDSAGEWDVAALPAALRATLTRRMEELLLRHTPTLTPVLLSVGNGLISLGNTSGALTWLATCATVSTSVGHHVTAGIAKTNIALALSKTAPVAALALLEEATSSFERGGVTAKSLFWLGNAVCERADILARLGRPSDADALLDAWLPRVWSFSRMHLIRGNLAWSTGAGVAATSFWLAGAADAADRGDAVWVDKLTLVAYAATAVAGFATAGKEKPQQQHPRLYGSGGTGGACGVDATVPNYSSVAAAGGGGTGGSDTARTACTPHDHRANALAPGRIVAAGRVRAVASVHTLLEYLTDRRGGMRRRTPSLTGVDRADLRGHGDVIPPAPSVYSSSHPTGRHDDAHLRSLFHSATTNIPWGVVAASAAKRNVEWEHWATIEEAASITQVRGLGGGSVWRLRTVIRRS